MVSGMTQDLLAAEESREMTACAGSHDGEHGGRLWSGGVSHHCGKPLLLLSSSKESLMSGQQIKTSRGRRNVQALCHCCARGKGQGRRAHTQQVRPASWVSAGITANDGRGMFSSAECGVGTAKIP